MHGSGWRPLPQIIPSRVEVADSALLQQKQQVSVDPSTHAATGSYLRVTADKSVYEVGHTLRKFTDCDGLSSGILQLDLCVMKLISWPLAPKLEEAVMALSR